MNKKDFTDAFGRINDHFIAESIEEMPDIDIQSRRKRPLIYTVSAFAAFAACLCLFFNLPLKKAELLPVSYLCIDINPSMELGLDEENTVISAAGINEDGIRILGDLDLIDLSCEDALDHLFKNDDFRHYLTTANDLTITLVSPKASDLLEAIKTQANNNDCDLYLYQTDMDKLAEAHEHDCSLNKYLSYEVLKDFDSSLSLDDCKTLTMHDLHEAISHCHEEHTDTSSKGENQEHHKEHKEGNHHGH